MSTIPLGEVTILLVEDSKVDAELIAEALKDSNLPHHLDLARDGQEALDLLRSREERPHLVLLDLNLPKIGGLDVLKTMRRDPKLRIIPVIVLSNSQYQEDVARCESWAFSAMPRYMMPSRESST